MVSKILLSALVGTAAAHFSLDYPEPLEANHDDQATGPCGGASPMLDDLADSDLVDFWVDGTPIATSSGHATGYWLYRLTMESDVSASTNWTQIYPVVEQTGLGSFCADMVTVPAEYVGQRGVISVVGFSDPEHGNLYSCTAVNFIEGMMASPPDACTNSTTVEATFAPEDVSVESLVGEDVESDPAPTDGHEGGHGGEEGDSESTEEETPEEEGDGEGAASTMAVSSVMAVVPVLGLYLAFMG